LLILIPIKMAPLTLMSSLSALEVN
jgi:hypothetical protein